MQIQDLLENALRINNAALSGHKVTVVKEFADVPVLALDKHRVLLILINSISHAKQAMGGFCGSASRMRVKALRRRIWRDCWSMASACTVARWRPGKCAADSWHIARGRARTPPLRLSSRIKLVENMQ